jgi:hypothetical protein
VGLAERLNPHLDPVMAATSGRIGLFLAGCACITGSLGTPVIALNATNVTFNGVPKLF